MIKLIEIFEDQYGIKYNEAKQCPSHAYAHDIGSLVLEHPEIASNAITVLIDKCHNLTHIFRNICGRPYDMRIPICHEIKIIGINSEDNNDALIAIAALNELDTDYAREEIQCIINTRKYLYFSDNSPQ